MIGVRLAVNFLPVPYLPETDGVRLAVNLLPIPYLPETDGVRLAVNLLPIPYLPETDGGAFNSQLKTYPMSLLATSGYLCLVSLQLEVIREVSVLILVENLQHWLPYCHYLSYNTINTLRPGHNGRHFPDDHLECIFFNENI